jgi:tetratricopeptide (TPR) repeat protein
MNSVRVLAVLIAGAGAAGALGCRGGPRWGTPEFNARIVQHVSANQCEKAIDLVKSADAKHDPNWYAWMVSMNLECLAKTRQKPYGDDALRLVDEGLRRFPRSSRLLLDKGFAYSRLGERGLALRYYEDSLNLALRNIAVSKDGKGSAEDRLVASNAEANLAAARKREP